MSVYLILSFSKVPARKSSFGAPTEDFASDTVSSKLFNFYALCFYAYGRKNSIWPVDEISICPRRFYKCSNNKIITFNVKPLNVKGNYLVTPISKF